jgi:SSS family solute:Na+ symporter
VSPHLALIAAYSLAVVAFGLWTSRYVRGSSDFFVAGRRLGPGLVFSSMLAANIGAGATVNAAGLAYRDGLSAWWWSGSAGLASFVLAFWVGPRIWTLAKEHGFYTTGDFLEYRYGPAVRGIVAVLVTFGSLWILAAQLMAGAAILNVLTGAPRWLGSLIGGGIMTVYFAAGGLLGTSLVNTFQLVVMLGGFAVALPFVVAHVGGLAAFASPSLPATFNEMTYSAGPGSGWTFLALTGPAFVISPGLIQKSYGAASVRALRLGIGLNAVALMLFAFVPVLLGMAGRVALPPQASQDMVLPAVLQLLLPTWLGALALAAVFSTEVDTSDAILFMISTSMSKDIFKRYLKPDASDAELLRVARLSAVVGGALGVLLSIYLSAIVQAMTVFYSLLGVSLFVPVLGGLYTRRAGSPEALGSIAAGVLTLLVVRFGVAGRAPWLDPTLTGLVAAAAAFFTILLVRSRGSSGPPQETTTL